MPNVFYTESKRLMLDHGSADKISLLGDTLKVLLVTSGYVPDPDHVFADAGGANDVVDHELNVTGYGRGWGGTGRKTLTLKTLVSDNANDRVEFDAADLTWTGLGTGQTAVAGILVKEGATADTGTRLIAYIDAAPDTPTSGGSITLTFDVEGILTW